MSHSEGISIRRFRESERGKLVRLITETNEISYGDVYPPGAVQFLKDFSSETEIRSTAARPEQSLLSRRMANWWLLAVWSMVKSSPCSFIQDRKDAV